MERCDGRRDRKQHLVAALSRSRCVSGGGQEDVRKEYTKALLHLGTGCSALQRGCMDANSPAPHLIAAESQPDGERGSLSEVPWTGS